MSAAQLAKTTNAKVEELDGLVEELDGLVVGGGFAGVYQLHQLRKDSECRWREDDRLKAIPIHASSTGIAQESRISRTDTRSTRDTHQVEGIQWLTWSCPRRWCSWI